jgi:hypothetical protein
MRAGIVVNVTGADRHQLEANISDRSAESRGHGRPHRRPRADLTRRIQLRPPVRAGGLI